MASRREIAASPSMLAAQRAGEGGELHVLGQEAGGAGAQPAHAERLVAGRAGEQDDGDRAVVLVDALRRLDAVHVGHHVVHHDHVGAVEERQLDGLAAVRGLRDDGHVVLLEDVADQPADERVVVGDQGADLGRVVHDELHLRRAGCARRRWPWRCAETPPSGARSSDWSTVERMLRGCWGWELGRSTGRARFERRFDVGAGFMSLTLSGRGWRPLAGRLAWS